METVQKKGKVKYNKIKLLFYKLCCKGDFKKNIKGESDGKY